MYILDSNTLIDLFKHYYRDRFPTLWDNFGKLLESEEIMSVSEVANEIGDYGDELAEWVKSHKELFPRPTTEEMEFVKTIFEVPHFQNLIRQKERLKGHPVADPFVIAKAKVLKGFVVTEELSKKNAIRIPDVCMHFDIPCINLKGLMENEGWIF